MAQKKIASYGSWESPITSDLIVSKSIGLTAAHLESGEVYWLESRPSERGRSVIVKHLRDGTLIDINPPPFNARTRVHEYGGGALLVHEGTVYFSNYSDQRLYQVSPDREPTAITPEAALRYTDFVMDTERRRIICVREDHRKLTMDENHNEAVNSIVALYLDGSERQDVLACGNDFYAAPRISPDGKQLAWLTWNHPNMPWDGTELWTGDLQSDGHLINAKIVAGGLDESIFQPEWSPDGVLTFISDRSGWWNIYRQLDGDIACITTMEAEFGIPQWVFGMTTYAYTSSSQLVCIYTQNDIDYMGLLGVQTGQLTLIDIPYTSLSSIIATENNVLFRGASPKKPDSVILYELKHKRHRILKSSASSDIEPDYVSVPESITYPTANNLNAHAFYYAPQNPLFVAPEKEKPPLLVMSHGGPTSRTKSTLSLMIQYWTSRGFAVLDVNYGGSSGYGRAYRQRLSGNWGIVDVDDCVNGALYLANSGRVDENRLAIKGGSAGGYTTLCALVFRDVFQVGASYYGVSDLEALALDTHKFESRYLDRLIGPYPQCKDLYFERSPIHNIEGLNCPVIFFQGDEDRVVPPNQTQMMVDAMVEKGLPVAYILFEGEQHGFRQAASMKRALDAELYFYGKIFNFTLVGDIEPVEIINLVD